MGPSALYIHIPFCHAKCAYCDFDSQGLRGAPLECAAARYCTAISARIDALGARGALAAIGTVYIGGGTPTVIGDRLAALVQQVRRWCAPFEFTCEANPESFSDHLASALAEAGVTRISLGVQSLDDAELRSIGRLHDADTALAAIARAKRQGFTVSVDLMCGLPRQTPDSWRRTLANVVAAGPDHVSVYPLTLEEGTPLARRAEHDPALVPDEDAQADAMLEANRFLHEAGYDRYEVASYALPGKTCAHNIAYWTGEGYLGIGRSAAGMMDGGTYRTLSALFPVTAEEGATDIALTDRVRLVQRDDAGTLFEREVLSDREALAEDLMLGMRLACGVDGPLIARARDLLGEAAVDRAIACSEQRRLAAWRDGRLVPTERGWLLGNELYGLMWGLADDG